MKKFLGLLTGLLLIFGVAGSASAVQLISNGDFETGTLAGWTTKGDVQVTNAGGGFSATQGMDNYYALIGLDITDGSSTLRQDFEVVGINEITISFNWAFDYWDNSASADDTFLSFVRQDGKPALGISLLDLETNGTGFWSPDVGLAYGFFEKTYDISAYTTDEARLIFRLIEESDSNFWTGTGAVAGIDNVSITGSPVPEPATMMLFGLGLLGLAGVSRKKS